ncbi:MAG: carboxypeptidase-like regulatory domain-containing protein [Acidobacteriota bacterium]
MVRVSTRMAALVVIVTLMVAGVVNAQVTSGTVTGTVKDAQGGVVPGVTVVLESETKGTKSTPAVTNGSGDFVFPNVSADVYTLDVTMSGFKTMRRSGVTVGSGNRVGLGVLVLEVGGIDQTVEVRAEAPLIQAQSGERSFTVPTDQVANLPIANRSFTALTQLAPGVQGTNRIGGGGGNNIMIDGVSAVDTGSNSILLQMNVESIAEVKVLTSGYQAEYGRSSGLQVTAVTKSGTNRFHGSLYDVERNSKWNANSRTNILNGDAKSVLKERDWGYSLGGPVGKAGGNNKLFFFYSHEYAPRKAGGAVVRFRVPTALERAGDFSKTYDNNGTLFTSIKDPLLSGTCSSSNSAACFKDGGVVGRIPSNRIYAPGLAILNQYPLPNIDGTGLAYNYEANQTVETAMGQQPALRVDYQPMPSLRVTAKYSGWRQTNKEFVGSLPGLTNSKQYHPVVFTDAFTINYTLTPTTFLEATYGHSQNDLAGCGLAQGGTGPTFCTSGVPTAPLSNRDAAGLGGLPTLFPVDSLLLNQNYYAYTVLAAMAPPMFVNGYMLKTPNFSWGGRVGNAPPNTPFSGFLNKNATDDISASMTRVQGRHTLKGGFYNTHSWKAQQQNSGATFGTYNFQNNTSNPLDTGFPYANALIGVINNYNQQSTYIEGTYVYNNTEGYIQDNWKLTNRFTLDYGVRFVHQQPQYDKLGQASNFLPEKWSSASAPTLFVAACSNGAVSCSGNTRVAKNPATGALLGAGSAVSIGTIVPGTGDPTNGLFLSGQGIAKTTYTWPTIGYNPRLGAALDLTGNQKVIVRGGMGLYFDRPSGNSIYAQVLNPPSVKNVTLNFAQLQSLNPNSAVQGPPALSVFIYKSDLPTSAQWNTGLQLALPWSSALDVSYVGQHAWNQLQSINLNAVDFGTAFQPQYQDPTQAATFLGSNTVASDQMRAFRGYGNINQQNPRGWSTYHSLQFSYQRRFSHGVSWGLNDTWSLSNQSQTAARLQHNADGSYTYRADQAEADRLLQSDPTAHTIRANFVWDLPDLTADHGAMRAVAAVINDWQLSGIWGATTASPYTVGFSYQNGGGSANLTGSPDYGARIVVAGDPGSGCSGNVYKQFNTSAFQGPAVGSLGLESSPNVVKGCFQSALDLSIARTVRLGGGRTVQLRLDIFNAPNQAIVTGRTATINLGSPSDPITATNLPYDATGALVPSRSLPKNGGFGVATGFQSPRTLQAQVRFGF